MLWGLPFARILSVVRSERTVKATGQTFRESRFYLSSAEPGERRPTHWHTLIRGHWAGVEIRNHWQRDVFWGEDRSRTRNSNALANLALLRSALLTLLPRHFPPVPCPSSRNSSTPTLPLAFASSAPNEFITKDPTPALSRPNAPTSTRPCAPPSATSKTAPRNSITPPPSISPSARASSKAATATSSKLVLGKPALGRLIPMPTPCASYAPSEPTSPGTFTGPTTDFSFNYTQPPTR
jgi:hypothetical protein